MEWVLALLALGLMWLPVIFLIAGAMSGGRPEEVVEAAAPSESPADSFFGVRSRAQDLQPATGVVEDPTVIWLQDYLRAEREQAERFVSAPSVRSLYKNCGKGVALS